MKLLRRAAREVISLVVDDGVLALAALASIGVVAVLSRESLLGGSSVVGFILFGLLAVSVVVSVTRRLNRPGQ